MKDSIRFFVTAKGADAYFQEQPPVPFCEEQGEGTERTVFLPTMNMDVKDACSVMLYPEVEYQEILGFGGAMTEAAARSILSLPHEKGERLLESYFGRENGIGYRYCRVSIGSSDFSEEMYDYVEEGDAGLKSFSLAREEKTVFRALQRARRYAQGAPEVIATPWSPPAWMKENGSRCGGGKLKPEYRRAWADYYVKYIQEARRLGIHVSTVSIQNEPQACVSWDSCVYSAQEERDFLKNDLGPALEKAGLEDVKVLIWDHNKDLLVERVRAVMEDKEAARYVWGAAFHWYAGDHFYALDAVHALYPELRLLYTEGCHGGVYRKTGEWRAGELIAHELFGDLNHWTSGCIDWNLALDGQGGPSHAGNYCDAPVLCSGDGRTFGYESSYYYIGHFSRYVRPGARRIGSSCYTERLESCAFKNPDGTLVLVLMNREEEALPVCIRCGRRIAYTSIPSHSIVTALL